jgi:two-component system, sensor histidine kinase and response regulator
MTSGDRLALWCLLGGLLLMALTDSTYAYLTEVKSYETGSVIDAGWFAGYLGIGLGAFCANSRADIAQREVDPSDSPALLSLVAPFLPMLVALAIAAVNIELGHRLDEVAWIMAFGLVTLVLTRQGLLVLELLAPTGGRQAGLIERMQLAALGVAVEQEPHADLPQGTSRGANHEQR